MAVVASASAAAPAAAIRGGWCEARPSTAWKHVQSRHVVALSRTTALVPIALARDAHAFFASIYSSRFSGVGEIDAKTSAITKIKPFPNPRFDQAWAAYAGRWLVWNEYHGFDSFNDFTTWAWDTTRRKLTQLGTATRGPAGRFWDSPWRGPDVRDGIATWVQGVGPDQLGEVHAYDLQRGRDLVVRRGHPGGAFLLSHHVVVWAEASAPGVPTRMHAASGLTGARAPVPRALRELRNVTGLQTDGYRIAYPNASYKTLWWSTAPRSSPSEVVDTRHGGHIDNSVQVGGRYVTFGIDRDVYLADTKSSRYVEMTNHGGFGFVNRKAVLVTSGSLKKVLHPLLRVAFVPLRDLPPIAACS